MEKLALWELTWNSFGLTRFQLAQHSSMTRSTTKKSGRRNQYAAMREPRTLNWHLGINIILPLLLTMVLAACDDLAPDGRVLEPTPSVNPATAANLMPTATPTHTPIQTQTQTSTNTPTQTPTQTLTATQTHTLTQDDVTPPELVELTLDRSEVDVSSRPATITVSARVSDDLSGATRLQMDFVSPSGEQQTTFFDEGVKATGSITDWVYVGAVTLPQFSESGTWTLRYVYVHDEVGNLRDYGFAELSLLGFTGSFEVLDNRSK